MRTRLIIGLIVSVVTVVVFVPGLMDPVEGSLALAAGGLLLLITWAISRLPVPRLAWISWLVALASGTAALVSVMLVRQAQGVPVGGPDGLPWWLWVMLALYEVAVLAIIVGAGQYVVRHVRALRHPHGKSFDFQPHPVGMPGPTSPQRLQRS